MGKIAAALEKSKREATMEKHGDSGLSRAPQKPHRASAPADTLSGTPAKEDAQPAPSPRKDMAPRRDSSPPPLSSRSTTGTDISPSVVAYSKPHSPEAEQFRMLKTAILFPDKGAPPRIIMVTSSVSGEGKSFVAANLAVSMAGSIDEYVLLMDCDLRRPSLHTLFGFPEHTTGLTEYLTKGVPLSQTLQKTKIDKLTLLPSGVPPVNPSELISSEQMRQLLKEARERYTDRYIIIDSPPPYVTAEANALAHQVDAIVIVVKTGGTRKAALKDLVETYGRKKILGVVKNYSQRKRIYGYE